MAETHNLTGLEDVFKKLLADKKKATLKSLQFIMEINRQVGFDEILLREGFESYTDKSQLEKNRTFKPFEAFFNYMAEKIDSIEQTYLRQSNDKDLIAKASNQNKNEYNFLLNKNNISKFISDEAVHYQKVLDLYLQDTETQDKGIKSTKMHLFFIELFKSKYISIIKNNTYLIESSNEQISVYIGNILLNYAEKAKDMTTSQTFNEFVISEEEILDFLTFWLKQQVQNSLFILYARTRQRLEQQSKILINKSVIKAQVHPSHMTKKQIAQLQQTQQKNPTVEQKQQIQIINSTDKKQLQKIAEKEKTISLQKKINSIQLSKSKVEQSNPSPAQTQLKKQLNKEQILRKELKGLFEFGCKRRYKLNKNTTFDQLENQRKTMDLEKFMNFCNFFQITTLINKQLLFEYFKMHALNTRIIDFERFQQIIKKVIKNDMKVVDNLLNRSKYQNKNRINQIKRNKKLQNQLSSYQFKLKPVNGKDVSTIEKELEYRKLQKQIIKEEKEQRAFSKRQHLQNAKIGTIRSKSNLSQTKISTIELQSIRDTSFNPEKLIQSNANDQLWNIYEAKIWKKQQKPQKSILQTLLSKRINRGIDIIRKMNSQRSFLTQ